MNHLFDELSLIAALIYHYNSKSDRDKKMYRNINRLLAEGVRLQYWIQEVVS